MIWDGAGFHSAGELKVPVNVTLIQLPRCKPGKKQFWTPI